MIRINRNSYVIYGDAEQSVVHAAGHLLRDIEKCCCITEEEGAAVRLQGGTEREECYRIYVEHQELIIEASSTLGFIYGIYGVSCQIFKIEAFWFWNDQHMEERESFEVPEDFCYKSKPFAVKWRGWFVNDEVLIHTWYVNCHKDEPWEMVFEALLRLGGNMVIPGTDSNSKLYKGLASAMGLTITHHHAEPLGAEMFARAYLGVNPSFDEHRDLFLQLWQEGIQKQKDMKVIWNLGFRGQGDYPFWECDPKYETPEARGNLMGDLIRLQYEMVKKEVPDAVCCTNLYGETMELYQDGYLALPDDVIRIWADNGFGKMVTRRQWNHNPRIPALPKQKGGSHGIYYHVSFYDLQAANHITMLQNTPEFVKRELQNLLNLDVNDYWIINCSNVKPHVYYLDFIAHIWRNGTVNVKEHLRQYVEKYYQTKQPARIETCFQGYWKYPPMYGKHEDEHAGDQFSNHMARVLISQYMKDRNEKAEYMLWATDASSLKGQIEWYHCICSQAVAGYAVYLSECKKTALQLETNAENLFRDSILLQCEIHDYCYQGAEETCVALLYAINEDYQKAFYHAGKARKSYLRADAAMRSREHGKWRNFYKNDCFTDVKQSAWVLEGLMSYVRNLGDGPHYYLWQRDFLYSEEDKKVMLLLNLENHLKDQELYELMEQKWDL
ncbi:MAG: glycosyl hydrolase 115 family protein [bacterium]|nr:glycosyl hydrolase 115 family protein [bacterium]